jgi:lauroyl/myristoyl acyltransferase
MQQQGPSVRPSLFFEQAANRERQPASNRRIAAVRARQNARISILSSKAIRDAHRTLHRGNLVAADEWSARAVVYETVAG